MRARSIPFAVRLGRVRVVFLSERAAAASELWLALALCPNPAT